MYIGIIGLGFVGSALLGSFTKHQVNTTIYDKYKNGGVGNLEDILKTDIVFLCLPTLFIKEINDYDLQPIHETCQYLDKQKYQGIVVIKSTVTPTTTQNLSNQYTNLIVIHNPEFLTAKTAEYDFHHQKHIILGITQPESIDQSVQKLATFYQEKYPQAEISICKSTESEAMKIFVNSFYAMKIQIFNEFYDLSNKLELDFGKITHMMLKNGWINPMHTQVPGTDGQLSYGGGCFPKDTNALLACMIKNNTSHQVLKATIEERNQMRKD